MVPLERASVAANRWMRDLPWAVVAKRAWRRKKRRIQGSRISRRRRSSPQTDTQLESARPRSATAPKPPAKRHWIGAESKRSAPLPVLDQRCSVVMVNGPRRSAGRGGGLNGDGCCAWPRAASNAAWTSGGSRSVSSSARCFHAADVQTVFEASVSRVSSVAADRLMPRACHRAWRLFDCLSHLVHTLVIHNGRRTWT